MSGDGDYGKAWDGPWAMAYPDGTVPIDETVHPTPIYETLSMGLVACLLWRLRDRFRPESCSPSTSSWPGPSASWSSSSVATITSLVGLTPAQLLSLAMIASGRWLAAREIPARLASARTCRPRQGARDRLIRAGVPRRDER